MCAAALPEWTALPDIGLYMDQVMTLMERTFAPGEITKSMVNNYVKVGLIRRPTGKKYDRGQLAQLVMIGVLKQALSMEDIARVLALLCAEDTQAGYAHFCRTALAVCEAVQTGSLQGLEREAAGTPQERAVLSAVAAAVCAMHAHGELAAWAEK